VLGLTCSSRAKPRPGASIAATIHDFALCITAPRLAERGERVSNLTTHRAAPAAPAAARRVICVTPCSGGTGADGAGNTGGSACYSDEPLARAARMLAGWRSISANWALGKSA